MKNSKLFLPPVYKRIGWLLFVPSALIGVLAMHFELQIPWLDYDGASLSDNNWTNELAFAGVLLGMWMMSFSRRVQEDEWTHKLRLEAFTLSFQISLACLFVANLAIYDGDFILVLVYNSLTPLLLFNVVFGLKLRAANKDLDVEDEG